MQSENKPTFAKNGRSGGSVDSLWLFFWQIKQFSKKKTNVCEKNERSGSSVDSPWLLPGEFDHAAGKKPTLEKKRKEWKFGGSASVIFTAD